MEKIGGVRILNKLYIMDANNCLDYLENDSIKMIYIDPPYNTKSKSFEYADNDDVWNNSIENLLRKSKKLLKEDGTIFISIDDNKLYELKLICDKIFGKNNFLGNFITRQATRSNSSHINIIHEYILSYSKNKKKVKKFEMLRCSIPLYKENLMKLIKETKNNYKVLGLVEARKLLKESISKLAENENYQFLKNYNLIDENGDIYFAKDLSTPSKPEELHIKEIGLTLPKLSTRGWSSENKILKLYKENKIVFKNDRPYEKHLLIESKDNAMSILPFYSRQGKHDLEKLGLKNIFKTAKPVELIKYLISIATEKDDNILDFFAGSGTTGQAVIELNEEERSNRNFILCQLEENINNNNENLREILEKEELPLNLSSLPILRLNRLKKEHKFDYQIINRNN